MKRLLVAIALLCIVTVTASAWPYPPIDVTLTRVGGVQGTTTAFDVIYDGGSSRVGGAGYFNINITGGHIPSDKLFCIDVTTYISSSQWGWNATRYYVPPSPYEPPFSIGDAVELYYRYRSTGIGVFGQGWATSNSMAAAVQLALWEITHEADWRAQWGVTTSWWNTGGFQTNYTSYENRIRDAAGLMLANLYANPNPLDPRDRGFYYRPDPLYLSQGLLGEAPQIPEPGTLILLGLGLAAAGAGVIRKRRKA